MKVNGVVFATLVLAATSLYAEPSPQPLQNITTQDQVSALRPGSTVVMTCAKCKTVQVAKVDQKKGILGWFQPKTQHLCPGCGGKIKVSTEVKGTPHWEVRPHMLEVRKRERLLLRRDRQQDVVMRAMRAVCRKS